MRIAVGLGIFCTIASPNVGYAQTLMQRLACTGDAMRLCRDFVPNHKLVAQCMEVKHDQLSRRCMIVFDAGMKTRLQGR